MAEIDIRRRHALSDEQARASCEKLAGKLGRSYGLVCEWERDVMHFKGSGVSGHIELLEQEVQVCAKLGLLLRAMKPAIEQAIQRALDEILGKV